MQINDLVSRVEQRLEKLGLTHTEASRRATGSTETIRNWMRKAKSGDGGGAGLRSLDAVAGVLRTNVTWLTTGTGPEEGDAEVIVPVEAPLLTWVSAGQLSSDSAVDEAIGTARAILPPGDWIALRVEGESMDRISPPGSIIFVDRGDKRLVTGGFYVIDDGEGSTTYKRFQAYPMKKGKAAPAIPRGRWREGWFEPVSKNKELPAFRPDNEPKIVGRVKLTQLDLT